MIESLPSWGFVLLSLCVSWLSRGKACSPETAAAAATNRSWKVSTMQIKEIKQTDNLKHKKIGGNESKSKGLGRKWK